ncbi:MAG: DUF3310 domain-containing protein [Gammaproteobacteria bacterium]|nr:DUF3310 domain-containing protein [Gammaproteobacteria bacterium]
MTVHVKNISDYSNGEFATLLKEEEEKYHSFDAVNPCHYKKGNIEVIDFILDQKMSYLEGNIIKYVSRYKFKNGIEDLEKARWYLEKLYVLKLKGNEENGEKEES